MHFIIARGTGVIKHIRHVAFVLYVKHLQLEETENL